MEPAEPVSEEPVAEAGETDEVEDVVVETADETEETDETEEKVEETAEETEEAAPEVTEETEDVAEEADPEVAGADEAAEEVTEDAEPVEEEAVEEAVEANEVETEDEYLVGSVENAKVSAEFVFTGKEATTDTKGDDTSDLNNWKLVITVKSAKRLAVTDSDKQNIAVHVDYATIPLADCTESGNDTDGYTYTLDLTWATIKSCKYDGLAPMYGTQSFIEIYLVDQVAGTESGSVIGKISLSDYEAEAYYTPTPSGTASVDGWNVTITPDCLDGDNTVAEVKIYRKAAKTGDTDELIGSEYSYPGNGGVFSEVSFSELDTPGSYYALITEFVVASKNSETGKYTPINNTEATSKEIPFTIENWTAAPTLVVEQTSATTATITVTGAADKYAVWYSITHYDANGDRTTSSSGPDVAEWVTLKAGKTLTLKKLQEYDEIQVTAGAQIVWDDSKKDYVYVTGYASNGVTYIINWDWATKPKVSATQNMNADGRLDIVFTDYA